MTREEVTREEVTGRDETGADTAVRGVLIPGLAAALGVSESMVTDDLELATLGLSSLEVMELVFDAEDQLDVVFREESLAEVSSIGGLVAALAAEVDARSS